MRILVIEDEKKTAAFLAKGLREAGFDVDLAQDGETGLDLARSAKFDLLIVDVMLPTSRVVDAMQAFAQSVHVVVHPSDLPSLTAILKKGLSQFELMYRVYRITVESQGDRRVASRRSDR